MEALDPGALSKQVSAHSELIGGICSSLHLLYGFHDAYGQPSLSGADEEDWSLRNGIERFRFLAALKALRGGSFNAKMAAINEINRATERFPYWPDDRTATVPSYSTTTSAYRSPTPPSLTPPGDAVAGLPVVSRSSVESAAAIGTSDVPSSSHEPDFLTVASLARWLQENNLLKLVLADCMHQTQYVEKLEKLLRFLVSFCCC